MPAGGGGGMNRKASVRDGEMVFHHSLSPRSHAIPSIVRQTTDLLDIKYADTYLTLNGLDNMVSALSVPLFGCCCNLSKFQVFAFHQDYFSLGRKS